jgi:predicted nicotinamide N-methyase
VGVEGISLYLAHAGSGLSDRTAEPPYWAYAWAGGLALARHLAAHPDRARGLDVLDFGSGSGLVAIAAARAGAKRVMAVEDDPIGRAAIRLNAGANGVEVEVASPRRCPEVDLVLAGDVFYDQATAVRSLAFLSAAALRGARVLIGDPYRPNLPRHGLRRIAEYSVRDFGGVEGPAGVFEFEAQPPRQLANGLA